MERSICHDPQDNPHNLERDKFYKICLYDGQEIIAQFKHVEEEGIKRYKFILGFTVSLRVSSMEFSVISKIDDYQDSGNPHNWRRK